MKEINNFLEEFGLEKNEFNVFIYESLDKKSQVNVAALLEYYRDYLIKKLKTESLTPKKYFND